MSTLKVNIIQSFTGALPVILNDQVGISGSVQVSGSITPGPFMSNKFDLGSSTKQWKDLYVDGTAYVDALGPDLTIGNGVSVPSISSSIQISGSIIPHGDDTYDLGSSTKQWKDLYIDGTANIDAISIDVTAGSSQDLASSAVYSVNGSKVEVKAITAANLADGAFVQFTLLNTSIAANSIVLGSFTGGTGGLITGSILTAATIGVSTASVQIHNETGAQIDADSAFTASFVIL